MATLNWPLWVPVRVAARHIWESLDNLGCDVARTESLIFSLKHLPGLVGGRICLDNLRQLVAFRRALMRQVWT